LTKQLEEKDRQISYLQKTNERLQNSLDVSQELQKGQIIKSLTDGIKKRHWWQKKAVEVVVPVHVDHPMSDVD
jgi:hypothetical protein